MMFSNNSYTYCKDRLKNEKTGRGRKRETEIKKSMDDARDVSTIKFPDLRTILNR